MKGSQTFSAIMQTFKGMIDKISYIVKVVEEIQQMTISDYEELYNRAIEKHPIDLIDIEDHFKSHFTFSSSTITRLAINRKIYQNPAACNYKFNGLENNKFNELNQTYLMAA